MRVHHVCVQHEDLYLSERHWESLVVIYTATRHNLLSGLVLFCQEKAPEPSLHLGNFRPKEIQRSKSPGRLQSRRWKIGILHALHEVLTCKEATYASVEIPDLAETLWHSGKVCTKSAQSLHKFCTKSAQSLQTSQTSNHSKLQLPTWHNPSVAGPSVGNLLVPTLENQSWSTSLSKRQNVLTDLDAI